MDYFGNVGIMLVQAIFGLLLFLVILRVLLPLCGARFRNPICQFVYRVTNPVMAPLSRALPTVRGVSLAGLALAFLVSVVGVGLVVLLSGSSISPLLLVLYGIGVVVHFTLSLYFWAIIIRALMSLLSPDHGNPAIEVLHDLTEPVLRPFQKLPPRMQGLDLSPLWACLAIRIVQYTLSYLGLPAFPL